MSIVSSLIITQFHLLHSLLLDPKDSVIMRLRCTQMDFLIITLPLGSIDGVIIEFML